MSCTISLNGNCGDSTISNYDTLNNISDSLNGSQLIHGYSVMTNGPCKCVPREIDPCVGLNGVDKSQCYLDNGYQQWEDECASGIHTGDGGLQTNDNKYISCDFTFPYNNNIDFGNVSFKGSKHETYKSKGYIKYDQLDDNIIHVSMNPRQGTNNIATQGIIHTLAVDPKFKPSQLTGNSTSVSIDTGNISSYKPEDLVCSSAVDNKFVHIKNKEWNLSIDFYTCNYGWLCIRDIDASNTTEKYSYHIFGLGPVYEDSNDFSGDWSKLIRRCNNGFGTQQNFGIHGSHYPIMYVVRSEIETGKQQTFGIFFDHYRKVEYYFDYLNSNQTIRIRTREPEWRFFVITGDNIVDVRKNFMRIVGPPSLPVRKSIGMHICRFGYKNWNQIKEDISSLQSSGFPVEGFILDLYWYGMLFPENINLSTTDYVNNFCHIESKSKIGNQLGIFNWDIKNFENPKETAKYFMEKYNYSITLIQEPYITADAPDFSHMYNKDMLATDAGQQYKSWISPQGVWKNWLGKHVAIPDFTNPDTAKHWFKTRIIPQSTEGTFLWWNDLGEPEVTNENAIFKGVGKVDENGKLHHQMKQAPEVQNFTQFLFTKGIFEEYKKHLNKRYNVLVRAGTCGIQRYGAFQWPGDTKSDLQSLRTSFKSCSTLSLCGIDFSVTDTGGFSGSSNKDSMSVYTPWFLNSCAVNFMVKPHKWVDVNNPDSFSTSSPSKLGDVQSNKNAIIERYLLLPYYYSWIYSISEGNNKGNMFVSPLWTLFQNDPELFKLSVKDDNATGFLSLVVGPSLLYILQRNLSINENSRNIKLPISDTYKGWYDYRNNIWKTGIQIVPFNDKILPLFIRDKSIIPMLSKVDVNTRVNILPSEYTINIYSMDGKSADDFELYEDDGIHTNNKYTKYLLQFDGNNLIITITGEYPSRGIPNFITNLISNNSKNIKYKITDNTTTFIKKNSKYFLILLILLIIVIVAIIIYFVFAR